jgi:outer membrane protein assembly factor BamB
MIRKTPIAWTIVGCVSLLSTSFASAQDWPQWRGPNRDGKASGFEAPKTWPKELTKKWSVKVGNGVATPSLVGDKLYVFAREGDDEVIRCLNTADGKEVWQQKYPSAPATGAAGSFPGPRSSPTVVDGKVVTMGVTGILSCLDAASGKVLWQKKDTGTAPRFFTSSSPLVVDNLCIVQVGSEREGGIAAYDMSNGDQKWKWDGDGTGYASPVLFTMDGAKSIVAETDASIVGIGMDGKLLWQTPFAKSGMTYNACTPTIDGQTIIFSGAGRGTKAVKIEKQGDALKASEVWFNKENAVQFDTPIVKNGLVFGITASNSLFCIKTEDGKTAWTNTPPGGQASPGGPGARPGGGPGGPGRGMRGGGRARPGYGSIVDAGTVLFSLMPAGQLNVFEPTDKQYKQIASYKVAAGDTYAYPVVSGNRIFIKDADSVTLWTIE